MSLEQEAKRMLMERLDDCLKVHADLLDSQDIGSIRCSCPAFTAAGI